MAQDLHRSELLLIFSISPADPERLDVLLGVLTSVSDKISESNFELIFRSHGADHFGYAIRSAWSAERILPALESPPRKLLPSDYKEPFLTNADHVMVLELGSDHTAQAGFARPLGWLQHHIRQA